MLITNLNNLIYNVNYIKNYIKNNKEDNYIIAYNNAFVYESNKKIDEKRYFLTSFARLKLKHHLYHTIKQNFPYLYEANIINYTFLNNFFLKRKQKSGSLLTSCNFNHNKQIQNRVFGLKSFFFSSTGKQNNTMSHRLINKKILTIEKYTLWLITNASTKEKKNKKKIKSEFIFSLKTKDVI